MCIQVTLSEKEYVRKTICYEQPLCGTSLSVWGLGDALEELSNRGLKHLCPGASGESTKNGICYLRKVWNNGLHVQRNERHYHWSSLTSCPKGEGPLCDDIEPRLEETASLELYLYVANAEGNFGGRQRPRSRRRRRRNGSNFLACCCMARGRQV